MIQSEKDIYLQETEIKPNRYAAIILALCVVIIFICFALTEIGVFKVGKTEMRLGTAITAAASCIPLAFLVFNKKSHSNKNTKYFIIVAIGVYTFTVGTLLTFHTTIMLLFPILFAMLYRSKKVGILAASFSAFCTVFSPTLGYILGTWDIDLFRELILIGTNGTEFVDVTYNSGVSILNIGRIVLYLVLPHLMMVGACAILMFYIVSIGMAHVNNQILLNKLSHKDAITDLYNQNFYKEILAKSKGEGSVGVIFFDVNGLKHTNDTQGHEYGDMLLKRCALSILNVCDEISSYGFRLGGDEFVIILEGADEAAVNDKIAEWQKSIDAVNAENAAEYDGMNCSMAYGYAIGKISELEELTSTADEKMYVCKQQMKSENCG